MDTASLLKSISINGDTSFISYTGNSLNGRPYQTSSEDYWVNQFKALQPFIVPFSCPTQNDSDNNSDKNLSRRISQHAVIKLEETYADYSDKSLLLLSAVLAYFYRLNNYDTFSVAFAHPAINESFSSTDLISNWVPLTLCFESEQKFQDIITTVSQQYARIIQHKGFHRELFLQHLSVSQTNLQVALILSNTEQTTMVNSCAINVVINTVFNHVDIYFPESYTCIIEQLIHHFITFLSSLCVTTNRAIKTHALLTAKQREEIITHWNQTAVSDLRNGNLSLLFEEQVEKNPNKIAIIFEDKKISYSQLNHQANQLARYIKKLSIENAPIIIYLPRGIETIICMLALLKSGNSYVPITIETPLQRLQDIVVDCDAKLILTCSTLAKQLAPTQAPLLVLDAERYLIEQMDDGNLADYSLPEQIAYVLYTSGSTGTPKGVQIKQSSLVNLLLAMQMEFSLVSQDILLALASMTFDISGIEIYLPLITGAHFILASDNTRLDPKQIIATISEYQITIMQATPVTWQMLVNTGWKNETRIKMLCTGEELNTSLAAQLQTMNAPLWNLYGPTETTIWSTSYLIKELNHQLAVPIGKPIANTQVYVLDKQLQPVPIGMPGLLYIGGAGVAQGYLNKPKLNEKSFIPNPFCANHSMMYYTGDYVKWLADGNLVYLGRADNQIKIRGFRIEIGEIEACLLQYASIIQAAVVKTDNPNNQLVAYLVIDQQTVFDQENLLTYLKSKLFDYMIPNQFVFLDNLPVNTNGKIDKKALLNLSSPTTNHSLSSPDWQPVITLCKSLLAKKAASQADYEELILLLLKQFNLPYSLELETNFFNLGLHSLLLVELANVLNDILNQQVDIVDFFNYPTARSLAQFLVNRQDTSLVFSSENQRANARKTKNTPRRRERT